MSTVGNWRGPNIVKDGLVLYLDAGSPNSYINGISGTSWKDISGNANNGTLTNGPTFDSGNGGSIVFDGSDDYVNFPHFDTGNSITVDVWFKKNSGTGFQGILGNWIGIGVAGDSWLITQNGSTIQFYIMYNSTSGNSVQDTTNISSNVWYNFTGTFTNGLFKIYRNGVLTNSNTISQTTIYQNTNNIWLGKFNNYEFNGNISIGKVYTRALSSTEISQNFNATRARFGI